MHNDLIVDVLNISKTFMGAKIPALDNISLSLKKGEMAALVGPDGAGKTTFLRVLSGLMLVDSGKVLIDGHSPADETGEVKKIIGYMPQKFGLYEDLSVIENLKLYAALNKDTPETGRFSIFQNKNRHKNVNGAAKNRHSSIQDAKMKTREDKIHTLLQFAGLLDFKERLAGKLSGGMKQKLGLCCTLISKPKLLLLDEPSVGVDPLSRLELMKIVEKLVKENNIAVIWSTSYLDEAEKFSHVFLFSDGKKIYDGSPKSQEIVVKGGFEDFVIGEIENKRAEGGNNAAKFAIEGALDIDIPENTVTIEACGLTKIYGQGKKEFIASNNITFSIKKGEIFGLLGPNGAGKSTTFKMLCGLIRPTSGYSCIMGVKMSENPTLARSYLGYTAQKFSLFGNLSVRQNLNFFAGVYGLFGAKKKGRIESLLNFFDLEKYANMDAGDLPLGYKQRLALSCAIVHKPPVLFLDEPTSGTDPLSRREFWSQINSLSKNGTTILVTTHFMDEAQYCNRISFIYKGKSLVIATPDELKNMAKTNENPNPTMEDAFIYLILKNQDTKEAAASRGAEASKGAAN